MSKQPIRIILGLCTCFSIIASAATINVTLNTAALVANAVDQPYSLEFDLENGALISSNSPGGPHTNASNIVTISNLSFGGGFALDPATDPAYLVNGGGSGDIRSTVILKANSPDNYLSQGFVPGSQLRFTVNYTNNVADAEILDSFDFAILDSNYVELPTQGGDIVDSFLQIDFNSDVPTISTFASDPTLPTSAGEFLTIDAPDVTVPAAVPEPGTFWILGSALFLLALIKMRKSIRFAQPGAALAAVLLLAAFGGRGLRAQQAPEFFTGTYQGHPVTYQIINGFAVVEGDMVIGEASVYPDREGRHGHPGRDGTRTANATFYPRSNTVNLASNLWPKVAGVVTVPYLTTKGSPSVTAAIAAFNSMFAGQFKWVPRTNQRGYVDINLDNQSLNSCYATLGYTGTKEDLQGLTGCNVSLLLHEMGHIMGFAHEQSRANRNSYLALDFNNIAPASQNQYTQDFSSTMDLGLYDYSSLMEYGPRGFTRNGNPEMESIPVGITFGDPSSFSIGDVDALNRIYFSAPSKVTVMSNPAGLPIIVDGANYTAPQSFTWSLNSTHTLNVPPGPQSIGGSSYIFGRWNSDLNADLNANRTITVAPGSGAFGSPSSAPAITVYAVNYIKLAQYNPVPVLDNGTSTTALAGSVSANPAPQSFPGLTGQYFVNRQLVTLTATPAAGNSFYGFDGPNASTQIFGPATNPVTLPSDLIAGTLYASFASQPEVIITTNITNNNASGASVTADNSGSKALPAAWSLANDAGWGAGTTHSVTAASPVNPFFDANTRYVFGSWTDGLTSATRSVTVPATGVLSVGVNYNTFYHVTANVNTACGGSVSVVPLPPADGFVASGTPLTFIATPTAPLVFAGWTGTVTGSASQVNTTASGEVIGTANFNLISEPLTINSISPSSLPAGSPAQSITIKGTGFTAANTTVFLGGTSTDSTYVNSNTLTVALTAANLAAPRAFPVIVENAQGVCNVDAFGPSFLLTP
jgi:hypothetical protein